jgi:hypothetical protein
VSVDLYSWGYLGLLGSNAKPGLLLGWLANDDLGDGVEGDAKA